MGEIEGLLEYGARLGVYSYFIYLFLPVGRGELVRDDALDSRERAELLELLLQKQHEMNAILIPVAMPDYWALCAPPARHTPWQTETARGAVPRRLSGGQRHGLP